MTTQWFDEWLWHHFGMTISEFDKAMAEKPLAPADFVMTSWGDCYFHCEHCFEIEPTAWYKPLDDVTVRKLLADHQHPKGVQETLLYPREPLLVIDEFLELLEQFPQQRIEINPAELAKQPRLIQQLKDLGVTQICYSLHGMLTGHCALTGQSERDWYRLVDGFRFAADAGFDMQVVTCICQPTIEGIENFPQVLDSIPNVSVWEIIRVLPVGRALERPDGWLFIGDAANPAIRRVVKAAAALTRPEIFVIDATWGPNYFGETAAQLIGKGKIDKLRGIWSCHIPSDLTLGRDNVHISRYTSRVMACIWTFSSPELTLGVYDNGTYHMNHELVEQLQPENRLNKLKGRCSPAVCPFTPICVGCPMISAICAKQLKPGQAVSLHEELDFCLSRFIYENRHHPDVMADMSLIIDFPALD